MFHGTQCIVSSPGDQDDLNQIRTPISLYKDGDADETLLKTLQVAASRGIPAVCANLDMVAVVPSGIAYMPGVLKGIYEGLGGTCVGFGKPNKEYFDSAVSAASIVHRQKNGLSNDAKLRAIHIGDSIIHDIAGAHAAKLDSILVTEYGVHKEELQNTRIIQTPNCNNDPNHENLEIPLEPSLIEKVCTLSDREDTARPTFILQNIKY
eukprot:CAMPEP_0119051940 /NCGR_PEP_ID=MMETSP1177-20130426/73391_1 /TAXON_ID=2985 /ORGANISM="Ochromonas sp, Strain CCMP1899" /LENGTH=207 /DNA_ID=CAMNT_0007031313 /DNA_START=631 /DNA_END=1254 /DNA_ORIENTATION=-